MFDAMFKWETAEAQTRCLDLSDFSSEVVGAFIEFLYHDNVAPKSWRPIARELWLLADEYKVRHITQCIETCSTLIGVGNVHSLVELAELNQGHVIMKRCIDFLVDHRELLQIGTPVHNFSEALLFKIILAQNKRCLR